MAENESTQQIAFELKKLEPGHEVAWVEHAGVVYFACVDNAVERPFTAVTQLIQYLFDIHVDYSFFILRNRIFTTEPPSPYAQGMVRLTAKRISFSVEPRDFNLKITHEFKRVCSNQTGLLKSTHLKESPVIEQTQCTTENAKLILNNLIQKLPTGPILHDFNRTIVAVLTDQQGNILEYSPNQNSKNKTLHAELLLLQNYYRRTGQKIPSGSRVFVSLKPCLMCAAALFQFSEQPASIHVFYLEDDPGPKAKNTTLESAGLQTLLK
jgi:tRNA(Arg) A34 adenosine deaminase TadA